MPENSILLLAKDREDATVDDRATKKKRLKAPHVVANI